MFIGHFGLGLASRKLSPLPSLAILFIAVQFLDLLWPLFTLLGWESFAIEVGATKLNPLVFTHYPYSHSLLMAIVWGILLGTGYYLYSKDSKNSLLIGGLVLSHWLLDLVVHQPDLPLTPFSNFKVGLGMWNYPAVAITLEIGLLVLGAYLYYRSAQPRRKIAYWSLMVLFLVIYVANLLGPPPPDTQTVSWSANLSWGFVIWAWWIERKTMAPQRRGGAEVAG